MCVRSAQKLLVQQNVRLDRLTTQKVASRAQRLSMCTLSTVPQSLNNLHVLNTAYLCMSVTANSIICCLACVVSRPATAHVLHSQQGSSAWTLVVSTKQHGTTASARTAVPAALPSIFRNQHSSNGPSVQYQNFHEKLLGAVTKQGQIQDSAHQSRQATSQPVAPVCHITLQGSIYMHHLISIKVQCKPQQSVASHSAITELLLLLPLACAPPTRVVLLACVPCCAVFTCCRFAAEQHKSVYQTNKHVHKMYKAADQASWQYQQLKGNIAMNTLLFCCCESWWHAVEHTRAT